MRSGSAEGGSVEVVYYAFGPIDVYAIEELPDHASAAALSRIINAGGARIRSRC